jgi:hypothetical protein
MGLNPRTIVKSTAAAAFVAVMMALWQPPEPAQAPGIAEPTALESATRDRLTDLQSRFEEMQNFTAVENEFSAACSRDCDDARARFGAAADRARALRQKRQDDLTAAVHSVIDAFVGTAIDSKHVDRQAVEESLGRVFPRRLVDGSPVAFVSDVSSESHRLAVIYSLIAGIGSATSLTVRMYKEVDGQFQKGAAIGIDKERGQGGRADNPSPLLTFC